MKILDHTQENCRLLRIGQSLNLLTDAEVKAFSEPEVLSLLDARLLRNRLVVRYITNYKELSHGVCAGIIKSADVFGVSDSLSKDIWYSYVH